MNEKEIYEYLKKLNLMDIIDLIIRNKTHEEEVASIDVYYTSNDLYKMYPNVFSKFKLDKYIKEENLPVIKEGKERLFLKSSVEDWLRNRKNSQYKRIGE